MKTKLFLFFLILGVQLFQAQEITEKEYEIYSTYIGEQGLTDYPIINRIPEKFRIYAIFDDSIAMAISKISVHNFDHKKLRSMSLKHDLIDPTNKRISFDPNLTIYFSPIHFVNPNEGYFITIYENKNAKPFYFFFKAQKINSKWTILDYNNIY